MKKTFHKYQKQFRRVVSDGNGGYKVDVCFQLKFGSECLSRLGTAPFKVEERGRPMLRLGFSKKLFVPDTFKNRKVGKTEKI